MGRRFLEFFAGGGMVRAGLGTGWRCVLANDFSFKKGEAYRQNWGDRQLRVDDVRNIKPDEVPDADLAWASFPCQDLSLAGGGAGLRGERSGTFYPFWDIISALVEQGRAPGVVVLENVAGTLTSHAGADFAAICRSFAEGDFRYGAMIIDAAHFLPHSRPRLFMVAVRGDVHVDPRLTAPEPLHPFHPTSLNRAVERLENELQRPWIWWNLPTPPRRRQAFLDVIEENPAGVEWHTAQETAAIIAMMSPVHLAKLEAAKASGRRMVGGIYRRTRREGDIKLQRAEVRFDDTSGCLRTPAGGSSRQVIMVVEGEHVRTRLISPRETARLMGLPDSYLLPKAYNEAYHLTGDGVAVPVVRHLAKHLLERLVDARPARQRKEACLA